MKECKEVMQVDGCVKGTRQHAVANCEVGRKVEKYGTAEERGKGTGAAGFIWS